MGHNNNSEGSILYVLVVSLSPTSLSDCWALVVPYRGVRCDFYVMGGGEFVNGLLGKPSSKRSLYSVLLVNLVLPHTSKGTRINRRGHQRA